MTLSDPMDYSLPGSSIHGIFHGAGAHRTGPVGAAARGCALAPGGEAAEGGTGGIRSLHGNSCTDSGGQKARSDTETHLPRTSSRVLTPIIRLCIILTHSPFSHGSPTPPHRRPPPGKRPQSRDQNLLSHWSSNFTVAQ